MANEPSRERGACLRLALVLLFYFQLWAAPSTTTFKLLTSHVTQIRIRVKTRKRILTALYEKITVMFPLQTFKYSQIL